MSKLNLKETLKNDVTISYDERDNGGVTGEQYLDLSGSEKTLFKVKKGNNAIDIIPFIHGTDLFVKKGKHAGDPAWMLDIFVHKNFNQQFDKCVCMRRTFGKPCPICEERDRLRNLPDADAYEDRISKLNARRRCIINVVNLKPDEEDEYGGQIQILDEVHYFFAKELLEEASASADEMGDMVDFYTPDEGKTVRFRASSEKIGKGSYFKFKTFSFEERDEVYDDGIIAEDFSDDEFDHGAFALDKLLKLHTYDEVEAMLNEAPLENDSDEDEEEKEPPASKRKARKAKKKKPEPEVEDEEEEEEEQEEEPEEDGCPYGHEFGVDTLNKPECQKECRKDHLETFKKCVAENMS